MKTNLAQTLGISGPSGGRSGQGWRTGSGWWRREPALAWAVAVGAGLLGVWCVLRVALACLDHLQSVLSHL